MPSIQYIYLPSVHIQSTIQVSNTRTVSTLTTRKRRIISQYTGLIQNGNSFSENPSRWKTKKYNNEVRFLITFLFGIFQTNYFFLFIQNIVSNNLTSSTPLHGSSPSSSMSSSSSSSSSSTPYTGCTHYHRKCQLLAPCCNTYYPCRFCHDEERDENEKDPQKAHKLNRKLVQTVKCMHCLTTVSPPQQTCPQCRTVLGEYFCGICNLYDDDGLTKEIFHCTGCGICRVGGKMNYFHCDNCHSCLALSLRNNHKCLGADSGLHQNCPVCLEYMHTSRKTSLLLPCGHAMHTECYNAYVKSNYKCPFCNSSLGNMRTVWKNLDRERRLTPMPEAYRNTYVRILCNDCHTETDTKFHIVGLKCRNSSCGSYNTRKLGAPKDSHPENDDTNSDNDDSDNDIDDNDAPNGNENDNGEEEQPHDDEHDDGTMVHATEEGEGNDGSETVNLQPYLPSIVNLRTFLKTFEGVNTTAVTSEEGVEESSLLVSPEEANIRQIGQALFQRLQALVPVATETREGLSSSSSSTSTPSSSSSSSSSISSSTVIDASKKKDSSSNSSMMDTETLAVPNNSNPPPPPPPALSMDNVQELQSIVAFAQMIGFVGGEDILDIFADDDDEEEDDEEEEEIDDDEDGNEEENINEGKYEAMDGNNN